MIKFASKFELVKRMVFQLSILVVSILSLNDLYSNFPLFSAKWRYGFLAITVFYLVVNIISFLLLFTSRINLLVKRFRKLLPIKARWSIAVFSILCGSIFLLYTKTGAYFQGDYFRLSFLLLFSAVISMLVSQNDETTFDFRLFFFFSLLTGILFAGFNYLTEVSNNPFSHSWSEGNRFYDYSLIFGKGVYDYTGQLDPNYESPGRYGLWGIWFLIPGLPIWIHRLWNAALWTLTPLILGILISRKVKTPLLRWGSTLWFALFLMQGPVYPTLLVALIFLAIGVWSENLWLRGMGVFVSSVFVGMSRYFWVVVPGVWIVMIDLFFYFPTRKGKLISRLVPTILFGLLGVIPGSYFGFKQLFSPKAPFEMHQPLLLYRLLPNSTYPLGILLNFVISFAPILILLFWVILKKKVSVDALQKLVIFASLFFFAIAGFIASTKIGGGSNLHNLDMFIVNLGLICVILVIQLQDRLTQAIQSWPGWIKIILAVVILTPGWIAVRTGSMLVNPPDDLIEKSMATLRTQVEKAKPHGEVLFIDQRQLLTFGYINNLPLIPDYEKKYMMDQAMGDGSQYFEKFYEDLSNSRFSLIISDPLTTNIQGRDQGFSEENNAYVNWVSKPLLKYYQPLITLKEVEVQILVPKTNCRPVTGPMLVLDCNY